jgi:hypothetical protein
MYVSPNKNFYSDIQFNFSHNFLEGCSSAALTDEPLLSLCELHLTKTAGPFYRSCLYRTPHYNDCCYILRTHHCQRLDAILNCEVIFSETVLTVTKA